jgi:16S rRNA (uracil1498-N3)-methyltransferase
MRLSRVHVASPLARGTRLTLAGSAANHVARVLRLGVGDPLTLFDGQGGEHAARIEALGRDTVTVAVLEGTESGRESPLSLTLAQGISRGERMDFVVQKATELGVTRLVPLLTARSVVRLDERQAQKKTEHWRGVSIAACEQCGRNRLPQINDPIELHAFLAQPAAAGGVSPGTRLLLSPTGEERIQDLPGRGTAITVLIGPEGGLAPGEQEAALAAGFTPVRLGPRVLRTETAALAALAILQREFGDL